MKILTLYHRIPSAVAVVLSGVLAIGAAATLTAVAVFFLDRALTPSSGDMGMGGGVLIIIAIPNVAIPVFVLLFTLLVSWHHATSWLTPTVALALCAVVLWVWTPFPPQFAPVVLGTGVIAWFISVWLLKRTRGNPASEHAL